MNEVRYGEGIVFGRPKVNDHLSELGVDGKIEKIHQGKGRV